MKKHVQRVRRPSGARAQHSDKGLCPMTHTNNTPAAAKVKNRTVGSSSELAPYGGCRHCSSNAYCSTKLRPIHPTMGVNRRLVSEPASVGHGSTPPVTPLN